MTVGSQSMVAPLRRVLMPPAASAMRDADPARWHYGPGFDPARAAAQHQALVELVVASGAAIEWLSDAEDGLADSVFTHDPSLVTLWGGQGGHDQPDQGALGGVRLAGRARERGVPGSREDPWWTEEGGAADILGARTGTDRESVMSTLAPELMQLATGRLATPQEVADAVVPLASPRSGSTTGAELVVDSGFLKAS